MPRRNWQDGMEIVYEDLNSISSAMERLLFDRSVFQMMQQTEDAFFNDGFLVEYASSSSVTVRAGIGHQTDSSQVSPEPVKRLLHKATQTTHDITTPDGSLDRIDLLVVKAAIETELSGTRKYKDAATSTISNQTMVLQKDWESDVEFVLGTPGGVPVAPSTPVGYLKIAELYVTAASGLAGAGAVTDYRTLMPVGGDVKIDTSALSRITTGGSTTIDTIIADIDALLKNGYQEYTDFDDLAAHPGNPAASKMRFYMKDGVAYLRDSAGVVTPVGSGGGGGSGGTLYEPSGYAPTKIEEYDREVFKYKAGGDNKLVYSIKVPETFITGRQIKMYLAIYSPSSANTVLMKTLSTLIRVDLDAVDSDTNQHTSTNSAITNTVAKQYRLIELDITDSSGKINSLDVDAGDVIEVEIYRDTDTDTDDVRLIPSALQLAFA